MYWKVSESEDPKGNLWITYNYFEIDYKPTYQKSFYNGITKEMNYPPPHSYALIIKAITASSLDSFLTWYKLHKKL